MDLNLGNNNTNYFLKILKRGMIAELGPCCLCYHGQCFSKLSLKLKKLQLMNISFKVDFLNLNLATITCMFLTSMIWVLQNKVPEGYND